MQIHVVEQGVITFPFLHTAVINTDELQSSRNSGGVPGMYQAVEKTATALGARGLMPEPSSQDCLSFFFCDMKGLDTMLLKIAASLCISDDVSKMNIHNGRGLW